MRWSENLVGEIDLCCGLGAFRYEIGCVANGGLNLSIGAASFEETLRGGIEHSKNDGHSLSIGATSFEEHQDALHGLNTTRDLPEWKADKVAQHLNSTSVLYSLFCILV